VNTTTDTPDGNKALEEAATILEKVAESDRWYMYASALARLLRADLIRGSDSPGTKR
jgi:hypothetical protein